MRKSARRAATLLIGLIAMVSPLLAVNVQHAQAATPTVTEGVPDPGIVVGPTATPKDKVYRGAIACTGGVNSWCWGAVFVKVTGSCSNYAGCFWTPQGNWRLRNLPAGSNAAQYECVASLGLTIAGALSGTGWIAIALTAGNTFLTVKTCIAAG